MQALDLGQVLVDDGREVDLVDVDLYLAEVERLHELDHDVATGFLLIASTLVELKARRLLPNP
ncbi:MAG: segregation/condensation protein A, partial [Actinomycetota bacterium]